MDTAEPWNPVDFFNVMLHEIGHAAGLGHSSVQGSVMYPTYDWRSTNTRLRLAQDDINGIRALFPESGASPPPGNPPPGGGDGRTRATAYNLGNLTSLASARVFSGTVNTVSNDDDYRRFTLTASRTMRFELRNLTADADLYLESSTGRALASSVRGGTATDTIVRTLGAGTYYVRVDAWSPGTISYQLRISQDGASPPSGNPPPGGGDGRTRATAYNLGNLTSLASARVFSDTVNTVSNDDDYRRFTLTASRTMRFELRNLTADADLYLESSTGRALASSVRGGTATDTIVRTLGAGTYYVRVDAWSPGTISYQLRISQDGASPPTGNPPTGGGDGRTRATAYNLGNLTSLASARVFSGTVNTVSNDDDYRRFTLTASRTMRFELRNLTADADLYLESSTGRALASSVRGGTATDTIVRTLGAGTYYVRVDAWSPGTISYQLRISQDGASPPSGGGDGRTRATAYNLGNLTSLASARVFSGTVNTVSNDDDYRRFTLTASRTMRFELRNLTADADLYLESSTGRALASSVRGGTATDTIVRTLGAGTYYVRVDAWNPGTISYQLRISQDGASPPPGGGDGRTRATAYNLGNLTSLASARVFSDTVNTVSNDDDYRRFTLTASRTMRFELRNLTADADLYLESSTGRALASSVRGGTATDTIVRTLGAGTYYVRVDAWSPGTISYQLRISQDGASPPSGNPPPGGGDGRTRATAYNLGNLTSLASARVFSDTVNTVSNDDDYRRFTLTASRTMRFELRNLTADADLYLESSTGRALASSVRGGTATDTIVRTLGAGTYYVRVDAWSPGTISYQLRISQDGASPPTGNPPTGGGDGRTRATAYNLGNLTSLASARVFSGTVNTVSNDDDYRRFTLTASRTMRFELRNLTADADLYLESSTGRALASSVRGGTATDTIVRTLGAGTYYVRVDAWSPGTISYQLRISQDGASPLVAASESLATSSQRLWRDRDMAASRNLRPEETNRFQERSGILVA